MLESETRTMYCPFALNQVATTQQDNTYKECKGARCMAWERDSETLSRGDHEGHCKLIDFKRQILGG